VTWTYNSSTVRASNGDSRNSLQIFSGLTEERFNLRFVQQYTFNANSSSGTRVGSLIGLNGTTSGAVVGFSPQLVTTSTTAGNAYAPNLTTYAEYFMPPSLGINTINACEVGSSTQTPSYSGTETEMVLSALWRG
jgi:hypothetical protein